MPAKKRTRNTVFWSYWSQAKKFLQQGSFSDDEIEAERQDLLKLAGAKPDGNGRYSTKNLTNQQFDTVLDLIDMLVGRPNKKRRSGSIIWSINKLIETTPGLTEEYLNTICKQTYHADNWRELKLEDLQKFKLTAVERSRALKKK